MGTGYQRTASDAPVTATIGSSRSQLSRAIGIIQPHCCTGFTVAGDRRRADIGNAVTLGTTVASRIQALDGRGVGQGIDRESGSGSGCAIITRKVLITGGCDGDAGIDGIGRSGRGESGRSGQTTAGNGAQTTPTNCHVSGRAVPGECGAGVFTEREGDGCSIPSLEAGDVASDSHGRRGGVDSDRSPARRRTDIACYIGGSGRNGVRA